MLVNLVAMAWMAGSMNLQSMHHDAEKIDHKQFGSVLNGCSAVAVSLSHQSFNPPPASLTHIIGTSSELSVSTLPSLVVPPLRCQELPLRCSISPTPGSSVHEPSVDRVPSRTELFLPANPTQFRQHRYSQVYTAIVNQATVAVDIAKLPSPCRQARDLLQSWQLISALALLVYPPPITHFVPSAQFAEINLTTPLHL
ncbi:hypothetical protein M0R45_001859 [Rubus argutus]|uniref:Uncharacterized protein n=1 Tax=Rubus argutus TaxID=59490 RepID=A0AAW1VKN4_RUBAR